MSTLQTKRQLLPGMHLSCDEFLERWVALPNLKYAELIHGVVYMPSPVSWSHSSPDDLISTWAGLYAWLTPGVEGGNNPTIQLGNNNVPQPDKILRISHECGGATTLQDDLVQGPPELAIEVSVSSLSFDLSTKLKLYEAANLQEYLVVDVKNQEIHWHQLIDKNYHRIASNNDGIFKSLVFPGLWLNGQALFNNDAILLHNVLQQGLQSPEHAAFIERLQQAKQKITVLDDRNVVYHHH